MTVEDIADLIRASALEGYSDLVRELGGDPALALAASRLRVELLGSTEAYIPFRSLARVLDRTAADLGCPDFGLRLATRQSIEILGPIALIARHSATARDALDGIARHMSNYSPALRIALGPTHGTLSPYAFEVLVPGIGTLTQIYQLGLGVSLGVFQMLIGTQFRPERVALPHAAPPQAELYRRHFGCRIDFDADHAGMLLPSADLDRRRSSDDPQVREHVARYLDAAGPADDDPVAQVLHLIERTLPTGHANVTMIAAHLGIHTRTLHRLLAKHERTFEELLDQTRRERARHYLTESSLPIGRIAVMLGYSQQSCLSRACARWFAATPRDIRAAGRPS